MIKRTKLLNERLVSIPFGTTHEYILIQMPFTLNSSHISYLKVTKLSLCEASEPGMTLLPNKRTWIEGVNICTDLGGQVE